MNLDYSPVQQGMPQNCSVDLSRIVEHVDTTVNSGNTTAIKELQAMFALQDLEHADDFAECVLFILFSPSLFFTRLIPSRLNELLIQQNAEPFHSHYLCGRAHISTLDTANFSRCATPYKVSGRSTVQAMARTSPCRMPQLLAQRGRDLIERFQTLRIGSNPSTFRTVSCFASFFLLCIFVVHIADDDFGSSCAKVAPLSMCQSGVTV